MGKAGALGAFGALGALGAAALGTTVDNLAAQAA
jgi:hypothetical protein